MTNYKIKQSIVLLTINLSLFLAKYTLANNDTLTSRNKLFIELGGVCGHYSFSYERTAYTHKSRFLTFVISFAPTLIKKVLPYNNVFTPRLALQINDNYKIKRHCLNYGVAATNYVYCKRPLDIGTYTINLAIFPIIGYSYDLNKNRTIGIFLTPMVYDSWYQFAPWASLRLGFYI